MNNVDPLWGLFFVIYKCTIGFAVVQVIVSVFIQQTFKIAARDDDIMIQEKMAASAATLGSLEKLFDHLDAFRDGRVSRQEWDTTITSSRIKAWFKAMDIDVHDVEELYEILDDGSGSMKKDDFIKAMKRIKGPAKSVDLLELATDTKRLKQLVDSMRNDLATLVSQSAQVTVGTAF